MQSIYLKKILKRFVGSSSTNNFGLGKSAAAIPNLCFIPNEYVLNFESPLSPRCRGSCLACNIYQ